jgi:hypothetical protein
MHDSLDATTLLKSTMISNLFTLRDVTLESR